MKIIMSESDSRTKNVVYKMTMFTGYTKTEYCYIGKTKRELGKRIKEHLSDSAWNTTTNKFIFKNKVNTIKVDILYKSNNGVYSLDQEETKAIYNYIATHGKENNKNNRLINADWKGAKDYTLKELKNLLKIA